MGWVGHVPAGPEPVTFPCGDVVLRGDLWSVDSAARSVVFLHGAGQTRHSWHGAAARVAGGGFNAISVDFRGHGDSDWSPDGSYGVPTHTRDLVALCGHLDRRPVLVGASLGGLVALSAASAHADLASAIVLVDVAPRLEVRGRQRVREFMTAHSGGFASLEEVAETVAAYTGRPRRTDHSGLSKNVRRHEDGRWYWHWDPQMVNRTGSSFSPDELLEGCRDLPVPVLIVTGGRSDVVSHAAVEELSTTIADSEVAVVPEAGHMVAGDDNDAFADALVDFLNRVEPQRNGRST